MLLKNYNAMRTQIVPRAGVATRVHIMFTGLETCVMGDKNIVDLDTDEMLRSNKRAFSNLRSLVAAIKAVVTSEQQIVRGDKGGEPTDTKGTEKIGPHQKVA
jgi:hypothetical protein